MAWRTMAAPADPAVPPAISLWQRAVLRVHVPATPLLPAKKGSCFVIDAQRGLLWTCSHVVGQVLGTSVRIGMAPDAGQPVAWIYTAQVVHTTPPDERGGLDGALLRINARIEAYQLMELLRPLILPGDQLTHADGGPLPSLPLGNDGDLQLPGDEAAILLGYSSLQGTRVMTPTVGIYSNAVHLADGKWLLTDSTMCPGHSGGPGLNERGEVVGWNVREVLDPGIAGGVPSGINHLRPVRLLIAELEGPAAFAAFGGAPPADVPGHLASQADCIRGLRFGRAQAAAYAQQAKGLAEQAGRAAAQAVDAADEAFNAAERALSCAKSARHANTSAGLAAGAAQASFAVQTLTSLESARIRARASSERAQIDARAAAEEEALANRSVHVILQLQGQPGQPGQQFPWLGFDLQQLMAPAAASPLPSPLLLEASAASPSSSSREASPARVSTADFGIVINGDYPVFDEDGFKADLVSTVNKLLSAEFCVRDVQIEPAEDSPGPRARVRMGSCEVVANCVLPDDHSAQSAQEIRAIMSELIEKYFPRRVDATVCQPWVTKLSRSGSIILVLDVPQPVPILLMLLAQQSHRTLMEAGILCCQLGSIAVRLEGCEQRHLDALAKAMEDAKHILAPKEEASGEPETSAVLADVRLAQEPVRSGASQAQNGTAGSGSSISRDADTIASVDPEEPAHEVQHHVTIAEEAVSSKAATTAGFVVEGPLQASNEVLRGRILQLQSELSQSRKQLAEQTPGGSRTSRAGFLRSLDELIGPRSPEVSSWDGDAWFALRSLTWRMKPEPNHGVDPGWSDDRLLEHVKAHSSASQYEEQYRRKSVSDLKARGWDEDMARCYAVLSSQGPALARALRERDVAIAPCIHALYDCIYRRSLDQHRRSLSHIQVPLLYRHLQGTYSLCEVDESWKHLESPDNTGFRGLCSSGITVADCEPANFDAHGYKRRWQEADNVIYISEPSDVVCFVSRAEDAFGSHCAVLTYTDMTGAFPPNTLFRLKEVKQPGSWEAPGGIFPQQRLLVVTATYLNPKSTASADSGMSGAKMCPERVTLSYGDRNAYVNGIDSLIAKPLLTMEQEFARETTWKDWKGTDYSLRAEWAYVIGPAAAKEGCTAGTRDMNNDGMTPEQFRARVNELISKSRDVIAMRGAGVGELMTEEDAFLTLDDIIAIRLFSGPAYQPINRFLREVSKVEGVFREQLAQHPELTFTATVRHLCCAIRKLSALTLPEDATETLYRGCRGELEQGFWTPDRMGMICAVDMAFMSTSKKKEAPIQYMSPGKNVLWQLHTEPDSDAGFHRGADISMLSQHASEHEILFPPMTLLRVINTPSSAQTPSDVGSWSRLPVDEINKMVKKENAGPKELIIIDVVPCFL